MIASPLSAFFIMVAMQRAAPITICCIQFGVMEILNCDKYARPMRQCQIRMICYGLALGLGLGLRIMHNVWVRVLSVCTALTYSLIGSLLHCTYRCACVICVKYERSRKLCLPLLNCENSGSLCSSLHVLTYTHTRF